MTEEQIKQKFKETYPDFMRGDEPLSPYFDIWEYGIELATKELQEENERLAKHILELQRDKGRLADENKRISIQYAEETDETIKELEKQIEKMKCCSNCKHFKPLTGCMIADKPIHRQCDAEGDNWKSWELAE